MSGFESLVLNKLSLKRKKRLTYMYNYMRSIGRSHDLNLLATLFKTDKWGKHFYTPHYYHHFRDFKNKKLNVLEIGVGGYDSPVKGGGSLRMWKRFFSNGKIFSLDIYDKSALQEKRIKIYQGSQVDTEFLESVLQDIGELDIIIDDGSHINEHVITSFEFLFPRLKEGGIYVVEDTQTSYWPEYGGNSDDFNRKDTIMGYFKSLLDGINHQEFIKPGYQSNYFDQHIISMHFYHNLIFIYKGKNDEKSNLIFNNTLPK